MSAFNQSNLESILSSGRMISEMRRVEEIQRRWAEGIEPMNSIAEQIRKLTETGSATLQLAKQLQGMEIQRLSNIKKMLDPLDDIRKSIVLDSGVNKMLEYFTKSNLVRDEFDGLVNNRRRSGPGCLNSKPRLLGGNRTIGE